MSGASSFQFLQPGWLLLLVPLWGFLWIYATGLRRASMWTWICDERLLQYMTGGDQRVATAGRRPWIIGSVMTLCILALAAPSWSRHSYPAMESTSARVIALDLSRSMLVRDVRPDRYSHAVAAASEIIGDGYLGETGLVVFAGTAFVVAPLSRDETTLLAFVEAVHPDTMPLDGSNLAAAIAKAQELLTASVSGHGQILLVTAGDSAGEAPVKAALEAASQGNRVSVLAVGSAAGGPALDTNGGLLRESSGEIRISRPDYESLRRITEAGNGSLVISGVGNTGGDLVAARLDASQLVEAERHADESLREAANDGAWLVWLILPLALLLFRNNRPWMLVIAVMTITPFHGEAWSQDRQGLWKHPEKVAYRAYTSGDFSTSLEISADPMLLGSSFYRQEKFEKALEQFGKGSSADAIYNRANTLTQLQRYNEAIAAYERALEIDPGLLDASYNKRLLELFLQQQSASAEDAGDDQGSDPQDDEAEGQDALQARTGVATEVELNPGDQQQQGPGFGALRQSGPIDPFESFDGQEASAERFVMRPGDSVQVEDTEYMERWISSLPETSSELYRRKFLRDYQRQQDQSR